MCPLSNKQGGEFSRVEQKCSRVLCRNKFIYKSQISSHFNATVTCIRDCPSSSTTKMAMQAMRPFNYLCTEEYDSRLWSQEMKSFERLAALLKYAGCIYEPFAKSDCEAQCSDNRQVFNDITVCCLIRAKNLSFFLQNNPKGLGLKSMFNSLTTTCECVLFPCISHCRSPAASTSA